MKTLKREEIYQAKLVFGELKFKDVWKKVKKDVICIAFLPPVRLNENVDHRLFKFREEKYKNRNVLRLIGQGHEGGDYYIRMNSKAKTEGTDKIEVEVFGAPWCDNKKRKIKFLCSMDLIK